MYKNGQEVWFLSAIQSIESVSAPSPLNYPNQPVKWNTQTAQWIKTDQDPQVQLNTITTHSIERH